MGIYHFAPVGTSPGAVTCSLAYLKHNKSKFEIRGSVVDSLVLFTSPDIRRGEVKAMRCRHNDYMSLNASKPDIQGANVLDVVVEFIKDEIIDIMPQKCKIYVCTVDLNDYDSCFQAIAKATLRFSPPCETGKHIWANLTGGTNVVNAALFQIASLTGLIAQAYYTFIPRQEDRKYLQPVKEDRSRFKWDEIPLMKTTFDDTYHALLQTLSGLEDKFYSSSELLSRFKQITPKYLNPETRARIATMDVQSFRREFLNKLDGRELERKIRPDGTQVDAVRLSNAGKQVVKQVESPLFQALVQRGKGVEESDVDVDKLIPDLDIEQLWPE